MSNESSLSPCCPPGSWDGPLSLDGPSLPRGNKVLLERKDSSNVNDNDDHNSLMIYYSAPPNMESSKFGIVVFHDVWGHIPRFLSICDTISQLGNFHVVAPDCFRGKTKEDFDDTTSWLKSHPYENHIAYDIDLCMDYLSERGVKKFGSLGFCWGGWVIAKSSSLGVPWTVGVSPHPSTAIEKRIFGRDEEDMLNNIQIPFLVLPGKNDADNLKPGHAQIEKFKLMGGKSILFENMVHGWVTRSNLNDPIIKADVEKALTLSVEFLIEYLH